MDAERSRLRVLVLEPYYGLSHRTFLEGYGRHSRHRLEVWKLPARKWKWRMRGAAFHFADRARSAGAGAGPDAVLASDFLNLCDWRALAPPAFGRAPAVLYFHENQVTYPLGAAAPRDFHYGWINLSSALAAERVIFNSAYHRGELLREVERVLGLMPDHVPPGLPERIGAKSAVLPVGIDFEPHRRVLESPRRGGEPPAIVWNHRWEHDKGPELMVEALLELKGRGVPFRAVVCGQASRRRPEAFARLEEALGPALVHLGFFEDRTRYLEALRDADVVLSTARHEFFGVSVVEALFMGCLPVLPRALSYPEIVPEGLHGAFLYDGERELHERLREVVLRPPREHREELRRAAARFDARLLAPELDKILEEAATWGPP
ncbi:MAG: DUF3524 domain-containing protein [Planctomycetes bacterium]|nr:DUF3524 domain-containing protein [Planctomycetota bacterium]